MNYNQLMADVSLDNNDGGSSLDNDCLMMDIMTAIVKQQL